MANSNIDERLRKPRRTRGTPFYRQRNLYALGAVAAGGFCWYLLELWPETRKLKAAQLDEGKFDSERIDRKFQATRFATGNAAFGTLVQRLHE